MQAAAIAQPNIALVKYWGKRDTRQNLPAVGSISVTLHGLETEMHVRLTTDAKNDALTVNGKSAETMLPRISKALDTILGADRKYAMVTSRSNFPIAAGLASSASAFAALTVAAAAANGATHSPELLARLAGGASGSAARSIFGGFVELKKGGDAIEVSQLATKEDWPLAVMVAVTASGPKSIGSTEAMEISRKTSPFYSAWVDRQSDDLDRARAAIREKDFRALAAVSEHSCLKMHSIMWASRPPLVYWNAATLRCMETIRALQASGVAVFFTIDAGPQLKAVCDRDVADVVYAALQSTEGVVQVLRSGLGGGARRIGSD